MQRPWRTLPLAACVLAVLAGAGRAQEARTGALERKALDVALYNDLRDVINRGADLYNSGDWAGCYRLYEGALMAVKPMLDHRPGLQKAIGEGITNAERDPTLFRRAFVLRAVIDKIRDEVNPNPKPRTEPVTEKPATKTLWERLGGEAGVKKIVNDLVARVAADPKVDFNRGKKRTPEEIDKLKKDLVEQISTWTGGPLKYTGPDMKEVHKKMGITNEQFNAFVADAREVLELNGVAKADVDKIVKDLDSYRNEIVQAPKVEPRPEGKSLWDRLGGEKGVTKIIDDLVDKVSKDPKVDFTRGGKYKLTPADVDRLKVDMVAQISEAAGGPLKYKGLSMKEAHKKMGITDAQFDAFLDDFSAVLVKNEVAPPDWNKLLDLYKGFRKDIVEPAKKPEEKKPEDKKPEEKKPEEKKPADKKPEEKKPQEEARVSGKVLFKGAPVPGGVITLHGAGGKTYSAPLAENGNYAVKDLPPGEYKITVNTEVLKAPAPVGPKGEKTPAIKEPDAKAGPKYLPIPAKYSDPKTSGLSFTAAKGAQTFDLSLE